MRASRQSFGRKNQNWKCNLHFILSADIQHKSKASPWPAKFNAIYMQPHTSLRGFCRENKSYRHPLVQICWEGSEWRFGGAFLGKWSEGFNLVQFTECAPTVTFPGVTGHRHALEMRRTSFSRCCSFSLHSSRGTNKSSSGLLLASSKSREPGQVPSLLWLTKSELTPSSSSDPFRW